MNGKVSVGHLAAGYLGLLLVGSATLAIGVFGSALARNQVLAAIFSGVIVVLVLIAHLLARVTDRPLKDMFMALALYARHFPPFQAGAIHLRDVVYYVAVTLRGAVRGGPGDGGATMEVTRRSTNRRRRRGGSAAGRSSGRWACSPSSWASG